MKRIGIDVGGTNTDAVLIDGDTIITSIKVPTTTDVLSGVRAALAHVSAHPQAAGRPVDAVMIGTTHFTNPWWSEHGWSAWRPSASRYQQVPPCRRCATGRTTCAPLSAR